VVYTGIPWVVYARYTLGGIYTMVHPPGYTSQALRCTCRTAAPLVGVELAALPLGVTEQYISDERVTVCLSPVSLLGVVERGITRRVLAAFSQRMREKRDNSAQRASPPSHHPFHCPACFRPRQAPRSMGIMPRFEQKVDKCAIQSF